MFVWRRVCRCESRVELVQNGRRTAFFDRRSRSNRSDGTLLAVGDHADACRVDTLCKQVVARRRGTALAEGELYSRVPRSSQ